MEKFIEIDGVRYTEFQIKRALALEKKVLSPTFIDELLGKTNSENTFKSSNVVGGY